MGVSAEWMSAKHVGVGSLIRGEDAADNQTVDESDLAVQVYADEAVVFTGSREELIDLGARIIEAAILGHVRSEASKHAYVPSGSGFCAICDDMPGEGNHK